MSMASHFCLQGGTPQPSSSTQSTTTEHVVRVPNDCKKRFSMIKFSTGSNIDFLKQVSRKYLKLNSAAKLPLSGEQNHIYLMAYMI